MKKYQSKDLSETIGTIGSMLLFLLFAGCMLMIIVVAAGTYSRISTNFNKTFGTTASLRYISNKIKAADSVEIVNGGSAIVLKNGGIGEIIYFEDGALYERLSSAADDILAEGGEKIFGLSELNITESDGFYKITAAFGSEKNYTFVRKGEYSESKS